MKMIITKTVLAAAVMATATLAPLASASASDDLRIQVQFFDGRRDEGPRWDRGPIVIGGVIVAVTGPRS